MRIEEVHAIRQRRADINHQTYKTIFENACERIRRRVAIPNAPKSMAFQVPPFVWGRPPYAHAHAVRYVCEKLRRNGFRVTEDAARPGLLHVDWAAPPSKPASKPPSKPASKPGKTVTFGGTKTATFGGTKTVTLQSGRGSGTLSSRLAALRQQLQ